MKTNPDDSVNPIVNNPDSIHESTGLTKREYFAAMAMQGMLASPFSYKDDESICKRSTEYADKLIEALNQTP